MDHAALVRVRERPCHLRAVRRHGARRQAVPWNCLGKRPSLDELHRDEGLAVEVTDFVDGADVRMVQRGRGARLGEKAAARLLGVRRVGEHLEGHLALQSQVARTVDLTHAAGADERLDLVLAASGRRIQCHAPAAGSRASSRHLTVDSPLPSAEVVIAGRRTVLRAH